MNQDLFLPVCPRDIVSADQCVFYHSMDFDDGSSVLGAWDIRGKFSQYIGNYPIAGKTLLDVGTASGFLAFEAERAGASVTALEGASVSEYCQLHFSGLPYHEDRYAFVRESEGWFEALKNGFWYGWHKQRSKSEVIYAPLAALPYWKRSFDVVLAGAILEHLSDPVSAIWSMTQLAEEAVIIAFTPVVMTEDLVMTTASRWDDPKQNFTWWNLSVGLYKRVFANVGFSFELTTSVAIENGVEHRRPTIIARRQRPSRRQARA